MGSCHHTAVGEGTISIDANEGFADARAIADMLDRLDTRYPGLRGRLAYLEQPVARDQDPDRSALRAVAMRVPLLLDEGLTNPGTLRRMAADGWTGAVVKAARGQSFVVETISLARKFGLACTIQDLTAVDLALEHSARLASAFEWSSPAFECNSRQFAPSANAALAKRRPALTRVVDGRVSISARLRPGIY